MSEPATSAGRDVLARHPDVDPVEVADVERQASGLAIKAERARVQRVIDVVRDILTAEQLAAVTAVKILDPNAIVSLDDDTLRSIIDGLARMPGPGAADRDAAEAEARRFLDEIM